MGKEPTPKILDASNTWCFVTVAASILLGLMLMADQAVRLSATYDEVTYLRVASEWWRTGAQESITRMGSPLTFWKIQQTPTLWLVDRMGFGDWIDAPMLHQEQLLPVIRIGGLWIWVVALLVTANWARRLHGPRAMAMASALFALSPNLLAHGSLSTMELPLLACVSVMLYKFWSFLELKRNKDFWASAAIGGLSMSCKFTTVLVPPILGFVWAIDLWFDRDGEPSRLGGLPRLVKIGQVILRGMALYVVVMIVSNLLVTGFATIPLSSRGGTHPLLENIINPRLMFWANVLMKTSFPQDWVGFATQVIHQRNGGPSYLWGDRRMTGWFQYYPVTIAVKVPLAFWLLAVGRLCFRNRGRIGRHEWIIPVVVFTFLAVAMLGSKRNYGFRYLLPLATPAIVWCSGLAEGGGRSRGVAVLGILGMSYALISTHPHELSYFNELVGGPIGGRKVLSDSNLDWGQGAKSLARLQRVRPEFRDLTLFYFGDTDPVYYGVEGRRIIFDANRIPEKLPGVFEVGTSFLAVSASLQWGPWGPAGHFQALNTIKPVAYTDDSTIAIYRTSDLQRSNLEASPREFKKGPDPG